MPQTTAAITWLNSKIYISTDGTAFTDISGFTNNLAISGGDRIIAKLFTGAGGLPIVLADARDSVQVSVKCAYTEGAADPYAVAQAAYENATALYVRWEPKSGDTGEFRYTTSIGVVLHPPYPQGEYGSGEVVTFEFAIECTSITRTVV